MSKNLKIVLLILTTIPIIGLIIGIINPQLFFSTQEATRDWLLTFGILAPIIFVFLQIIQVIFPPISHYTVGIIGGFIYGPLIGGVLNWIGRIVGHTIAFFISKKFGRNKVERFLSKEDLQKLDKLLAGNKDSSPQTMILFFIYFLPLFPDDEVSYVAGVSKMKYKMFFWANFFGHLGGAFSLAYIGSGIDTKDPIFWILFISTMLGFPALWYYFKRKSVVLLKK
jgi:uncharacterized membrane protein YdjX (TVP38/TMEM64 family)